MAEPTTPTAPPPQPPPTPPANPPADPKGKPPETSPTAPPPDAESIRKQVREELKREMDAEAERQRKEAETKAAKEQGKWKELAETHESAAKTAAQEAAAARDDLARERAANALRRHVAEKHPDYIGCVDEFMVPLLKVDAKTKPEDVQQQAEAIAKKYAELNPRAAKGGGAPPALAGTRTAPEPKPDPTNNNGGRRRLSPITRGF